MQTQSFSPSSTPQSHRASVRLNLGIGLMLLSFLVRASAACVLVQNWRDGRAAILMSGVYLGGKLLFYLGLMLSGPAALQRYPWLRPTRWHRKDTASISTGETVGVS